MANTIIIKNKADAAGVPQEITGGHASGMYVGELAVNTSTGTSGAGENRGHVFMGVSHTSSSNTTDIAAGSPTTAEYTAAQTGGVVWVGAPILASAQGIAGNSDYMLATVKNIKTYVDAQVAGGDTTLANTKIWIGDSGGAKAEFPLSGDVSMTAGGAVTIADNAVSLAKMAGLDRGHIIYGDSSGNPASLANSTTDGHVLTVSNANGDIGWEASASGLDVSGTDNRMVRMHGTDDLQDTGITIDDSNNVSGVGTFGSGAITSSGLITGGTFDSGNGATEIYDMNQDIRTDDAVTFLTVDTGQGANELYDMDQNVKTTNAVTFATVDTGQGANELYDMNQNVKTDSTVEFAGLTADATTFAGDMSVTADTATFTSANSADPLFIIKNTTDDAAAPRLRFVKDKGGAGDDDDFLGQLEFYGDNDAQEQTLFGKISCQVEDASNGTEGGRMSFGLATHDGEFQNGIIMVDGSAEDEIDITIGSGSASVTTISGDLTVSGTTTTVNSTTLSVADDLITCSKGNDTVANADGSGLEIDATGATNLYWKYVHANTAWQSNVDIDTSASGNVYKIAGTEVLGPTTLGSAVVTSSLTTVGDLNAGSITSGFTSIDVGAGAISTTGVGTVGSLTCTAAGTFGGGYGSSGATISTAGAISANGAIQFSGALNVDGATTCAAITSDGAISTSSTFNVDGASTMAAITSDGAISTSSTFNVDGASTMAAITSDGAISTSSTFNVDGASTMAAITSDGAISTTSTLNADGAVTLGATGVMTTINGTFNVDEAATFDTTLGVTGAATVASLVCTAAGTFGGGYGATGTTIATNGNISYNGVLTDGVFTMTAGALAGSTINCGSYTA